MNQDNMAAVLIAANGAALHDLDPQYYLPASIRARMVRFTVMRALLALSDHAPDDHARDWLLECAMDIERVSL